MPSPSCINSSTCKRTASKNKRKRSRGCSKKRNKMLPSRIARLLKSKVNVVRPIPYKTSLCNIEYKTGDGTFTMLTNSYFKCGKTLCKDKAFVEQNDSVSSSSLQFSTEQNDTDTGLVSPTSSNRIDRCIALDCEMVGIGLKNSCALGRCSIVNYHGDVIYDKYVKPEGLITNYRTQWSGITKKHMQNAVPFNEAKEQISKILHGQILIGHDLQNDFSVLQLTHPKEDIRDTSGYLGLRYLAGVDHKKRSVGLKVIVGKLMGQQIQIGQHCSVQDARAAMCLYRLVERMWEEDATSLFPDGQFRSSFLDDHFWPDDL